MGEKADILTPNRMKRKRDNDLDDGYNTDKEALTLKKKAGRSKSRGTKTTSVIRKDALDSGPWTQNVESYKVICLGCKKTIKLNPKRPYETDHWDSHKEKCPQITGSRTVRTLKKARVNQVSITLYAYSH